MKFDYYIQVLDKILDDSEGVVSFADALKEGIPKDAFYRYVEEKELEKHGRGLYLSKDAFPDELAALQARRRAFYLLSHVKQSLLTSFY